MYAAKPVNIKNTANDENNGQGLGVNKKNPPSLTLKTDKRATRFGLYEEKNISNDCILVNLVKTVYINELSLTNH